MIDVQEKKEKILSFIEKNGPSLPVRIAKIIEMEPMFTSAILSELLNARKLKMSNLRVGSSALYLIQGQEQKLEDFTDNLKSVEKDTYLKLKERKILIDEDEEPVTRVALRNLKDFAIPFEKNEKILWKYAFSTEEEINKILNPKKEELETKEESKTENRIEYKIEKEELIEKKQHDKTNKKRESKTKEVEKIFEEKESVEEKPEFLIEVKEFLNKNKIEFIEEIKTEKKEIIAKVLINSNIGKIKFLLIAKNKSSTNKEELNAAIQQARYNKMPCLFLIKKEPNPAIKKFLEENYLIRLIVM